MNSVYLKAPVRTVVFDRNNELFYSQGDRLHFKGSEIIIPGSERIITLNLGKEGNLFITTEFNLFVLKDYAQLSRIQLPTRDRILAVFEEEGNTKLWVVQARGTVHLYENYKLAKTFSLSESSAIFYSASIMRLNNSRVEVAFGTIFSGILITHIDESSSLFQSNCSLEGHKGTIFDIRHHPQDVNILVSCSDDRSVRIWKRSCSKFEQTSCCIGHEARVWAINICKDKIASVSEDNSCRIWDIEKGQLAKCIEYESSSKSIWSVSFNKDAEKLALGSNDGSVIIHDISIESVKQYHKDYNVQMKNFAVTHQGDVYFTNSDDQLICLTKEKNISFTGKIEEIQKFPAITVIPNYLFLADDFGNVYIKNTAVYESEVQNFNFKLSKKINKMFVIEKDCLLMQTVNNEIHIYDNGNINQIQNVDYKVTAFHKSSTEYFIGTRQGILLILDDKFNIIREIKVSESESLKSIKLINNFLHVIDRLGVESIFDSNYEDIERKTIITKGTIEDHFDNNILTSFYQQYFVISSPEIGITEQKIFCGGGHRLWSFAMEKNEFTFAYTSNGKINLYHGHLNRAEIVSQKSHGKEIRCAHTFTDEMALSGSEDGLVVLHKGIDEISRTRLSNTSIKCITSAPSHQIYFIGGSNETVEAFKIDKNFRFIHLASCPKQIKDIETRVLCMDTSENVTGGSVFLFVGYSDASIRVFEFDKNMCFRLSSEIAHVHHNRCVQQLKVIDGSKFITAGADGFITAWTFGSGTIESIWNLSVHESGINGLDILKPSEDEIKILTGGEDGNVVLTEIIRDNVKKISSRQAHNSTVTGVKFYSGDALLLSTSADRYIVLCGSDNETESVKEIKRTIISDISALTVTSGSLITVYGSGIESFRLE